MDYSYLYRQTLSKFDAIDARQTLSKFGAIGGIQVATLCRMLKKGDTGSAKNACFAVSCLAADTDGNYRILNNSAFNDVTNRLLMLLANDEDIEAAWFAAM